MRADTEPDLEVGETRPRVETVSDFAVGTSSDQDIEPLPDLDDLLPEPYVPEPIEHERTQVFARPSEAVRAFGGSVRLAWPDDAQVTSEDAQVTSEHAQVTRDDDPGGLAALGSQPYAIARLRFAKSSTPPPVRERPIPSLRERTIPTLRERPTPTLRERPTPPADEEKKSFDESPRRDR